MQELTGQKDPSLSCLCRAYKMQHEKLFTSHSRSPVNLAVRPQKVRLSRDCNRPVPLKVRVSRDRVIGESDTSPHKGESA